MNPKFNSRKKNNSSPIIDTSEGLKSQESSFADQTTADSALQVGSAAEAT